MKKTLIGIISILVILGLYTFLINPSGFKVAETQIKKEGLPDGLTNLKIMQFGDLLINDDTDIKRLEKVVKEINDINPEVVIFNGDIFNSKKSISQENIKKVSKLFKKIDCKLYKYAVIGDNDSKNLNEFYKVMEEGDFKVLDNESVYLFYKDVKPIKITGLSNLDNVNSALTMQDNLETALNIVVSHFPDYVSYVKSSDADVFLAGHSLHGQINVPFVGGVIKKEWAKKYINSYYNVDGINLYITGGIGTENGHFRFLNKPEINLYKLSK